MIDLNLKIKILNELGFYISNIINNNPKSILDNLTKSIINKNRWFDEKSIIYSLKVWSNLLKSDLIEKWLDKYKLSSIEKKKTIALILPGNIPLVGFHDILCVWILDYKAIVKLSSKDDVLIPFLTDYLEKKSGNKSFLYTTSSIKKFDAVIATGSNNSSIYFKYYFSKYPNIIRKNRTSIAVLEGNETELDLKNRKIKLSVKAAQIDEEKSLIAKFGEGATKSGATLKGIFEKAIGSKKKKKEEK